MVLYVQSCMCSCPHFCFQNRLCHQFPLAAECSAGACRAADEVLCGITDVVIACAAGVIIAATSCPAPAAVVAGGRGIACLARLAIFRPRSPESLPISFCGQNLHIANPVAVPTAASIQTPACRISECIFCRSFAQSARDVCIILSAFDCLLFAFSRAPLRRDICRALSAKIALPTLNALSSHILAAVLARDPW